MYQLVANAVLQWFHRFAKQKISFVFRSTEDLPKITLKTEGSANQQKQKYYGTMLFMSKQISLPKISSILQKIKSAQRAIYI